MKAVEARRIAIESELGQVYDKIRKAAEVGNMSCDVELNDEQRTVLVCKGYVVSAWDDRLKMECNLGRKAKFTVRW